MKTTFDIPDVMYRQVKARSALEGRAIREVVIDLFAGWLGGALSEKAQPSPSATIREDRPAWFGSLGAYAANAGGRFDMESVRRSIARGRRRERTV